MANAKNQPEAPPRGDKQPVILAGRNLRKTYRLGRVDVPVLKGASIDVRQGEWVAVLGASGSGKSTLLHLLGDLDRPDGGDGSVTFDGAPIVAMTHDARGAYRNGSVGFVFQFYHLLPELNVLENALLPGLVSSTLRPMWHWVAACLAGAVLGAGLTLALGAPAVADPMVQFALTQGPLTWPVLLALATVVGGVGALAAPALWTEAGTIARRFSPLRADRRKRTAALLESFGLGHRLTHRPRELSGGERQRVAIARALVNNPRILLADEPTGNLDEKTGGEILDILAQQHRKGLTIVMVTHDRAVAARADRIVHLYDGRVTTGE